MVLSNILSLFLSLICNFSNSNTQVPAGACIGPVTIYTKKLWYGGVCRTTKPTFNAKERKRKRSVGRWSEGERAGTEGGRKTFIAQIFVRQAGSFSLKWDSGLPQTEVAQSFCLLMTRWGRKEGSLTEEGSWKRPFLLEWGYVGCPLAVEKGRGGQSIATA